MPRKRIPYEDHYIHVTGPFATVRGCKYCKFSHKFPSGKGMGRGWGMREGNISRGILIQHLKSEHPEKL